MELLFGLIFLIAAWHGIKYGVPRTMRALGNRRRASIGRWRAAHPNAPASARWVAGAAHGITALRWGPGYFRREFTQAFRDAWADGRRRYRLEPPAPIDDVTEADEQQTPPTPRPQPPAQPAPNGRPNLRSVPPPPEPTAPTEPVQPQRRSTDMPTATTIEVTNPETLKAFMDVKVQSAAAELEDAQADARRAEAAVAEIERTTAALTNLELRPEDVAQVKALLEPDQQWLAAARSRIAAADQRLAAAKAAQTMAVRHVELQANGAAGRFYNRAG